MQIYTPDFAAGLQRFLRWDSDDNKPLKGKQIITKRESLISSGNVGLVTFKLTEHFNNYFFTITAKTKLIRFEARREQHFGDVYVRQVEFEETLEELTKKELKKNPEQEPRKILKISKDSLLVNIQYVFKELVDYILDYTTGSINKLPDDYPENIDHYFS